MVVTIHQPEHLPWLGFFNKMSMADVYVILDNVQYVKGNYQNRNRIIGTNGPQWIFVPVNNKGRMESTILDMTFADETNSTWRKKYLNTLYCSYHKYPYFEKYYAYFEELMAKNYTHLCDFNLDIIFYFAELLEIKPQFIRASELETSGKKSDLVLSICKAVNADVYISGEGGRHYMKLDDYEQAGIDVVFQKYKHPEYVQHTGKPFEPYMSVLDLLFNVDIEEAKGLVKDHGWCEYEDGRRWK
jgi:hypothetical protein